MEFILSFSFFSSQKQNQRASIKRKGLPWQCLFALVFLLQAGAAHALSAACSALNSASNTTSYNNRFLSTDFASGESVSFSYADNGQGIGGPAPTADLVNIRSRDLSTIYSDYRSNTGSPGTHMANVSASQLATGGLFVRVTSGTYIGPVTISCTSAVSTDASLSNLTVSAGTLSPVFASDTTSYSASVSNVTASLIMRPTVSTTGATITVNGVSVVSGTDSSPINLNVGSNNIDVIVTAADGLTTKSYTVNVTRADAAPAVSDVTATVAANSANNPITLAITGTPTSVAVASAAAHGTATASGTTITYTPTAGYSGSDSFTYTATNGSGTSSPATVTLTVSHPALVVIPSSGALPGAHVGTTYNQSISSSGGASPYSYSSTGLPSGLGLNPTTGSLSGTPTAAGNYTFSIVATDANGATGTASYTLVITAAVPITGAVSATVASNSSSNPLTLLLSGGTADSVAVATAPAHGTATASGLSIAYTPAAGFSGTDNFTYTATNTSGTSAPAPVTITVTASPLALSPAAGALPRGQVASAYSESISASGGTAPYHYSATGLPNGIGIDASTGLISGAPSAPGTYNLSVTVTDSASASGAASYTLEITDAVPVVSPVSATVGANTSNNLVPLALSGGTATTVSIASAAAHGTATATGTTIHYTPNAGYSGTDSFTYNAGNTSGTSSNATITITVSAPTLVLSPAAGALPAATVGTAYHQVFSVTGGASPYSFSASGMPTGLTLDAASGTLSGTPTVGGNASISVTATDAHGVQTNAAYTLAISGTAPRAIDAAVAVDTGQAVDVDLSSGATGGPFISATLLQVPAPDMGTARLNGLRLSFTPTAKARGTLVLRYALTSLLGTSPPATLTIQINARPDPGQDREVVGTVNAQAQSAAQFAKAQISNFNDRLEQLHGMDGHRNAFNLRFGLAQAQASRDVQGDDMGISRSLSSLQAATDDQWAMQRVVENKAAEDKSTQQPLNQDISLWTGGYVDFGKTERGGAKVSNTLIGISGGIDYRLSRSLTVGAGIGFGKDKNDIGSSGSTSRGDSYSAAVYGSYHPGPVFLDALLGYSWLSFDSDRYVTDAARYASGNRKGDQLFSSLSSGYEAKGENWLVSPYGRLDASTTWLRGFTESDAGAYDLEYADQRLSLFSGTAGLRGQYGIPLGWANLNLRSRLEYSHTFDAGSSARMGYADIGDMAYSIRTEGLSQDTVLASLGVDFQWASGLTTGIGYQGTRALGESSRSDSLSVRMAYRF